MICRGGDVGGARHTELLGTGEPLHGAPAVSWLRMAAAIAGVSIALPCIPGRTKIAPLVESDYCYQLIAADRMFEGHGPTCPKPVAPFQPWEWEYDRGFLTHWPIGYSLLVVALRKSLGLATMDACRWISVAACATALVGWFVWARRVVPRGLTGWLLGAVAAGSAVGVGSLINPSTDVILAAVLPMVMLATVQGVEAAGGAETGARRRSRVLLAAAGLMAGGLFWIRYASIFVPLGVGLYVAVEWRLHRRLRAGDIVVYACCAALPVAALLIVNGIYGAAESVQAQLNLGHTMGFDPSLSVIGRAWWMFTDLGYYDYHPVSHWIYALWPMVLVATSVGLRRVRATSRSFVRTSSAALGICVLVSALSMLVVARWLFQGKFDYVGLERYYVPVRPLYFVIFVAPVILTGYRNLRILACVALFLAGSWTLQQEWSPTYRRWLGAGRAVTPYGQWSRCFEPGAAELFAWLRERQTPELVVFSNFHEYVALETGIPSVPIPADEASLRLWLERIREARGVKDIRPLFVLDPDNRWRSQWIPDAKHVIEEFRLTPQASALPDGYVYTFTP